jgi:hypothetical protein
MNRQWNDILWRQFGAAIDMLGNAIQACPDALWGDRSRQPEYWYTVYHTLFFLDCYLSGTLEGFAPPAPFNLDELDPAGLLPDRVYSKVEMLDYLTHGRRKCRETLEALTEERACQRSGFEWQDFGFGELLLDNLRHVQHHAAQLNLILRQAGVPPPRWIASVKE